MKSNNCNYCTIRNCWRKGHCGDDIDDVLVDHLTAGEKKIVGWRWKSISRHGHGSSMSGTMSYSTASIVAAIVVYVANSHLLLHWRKN